MQTFVRISLHLQTSNFGGAWMIVQRSSDLNWVTNIVYATLTTYNRLMVWIFVVCVVWLLRRWITCTLVNSIPDSYPQLVPAHCSLESGVLEQRMSETCRAGLETTAGTISLTARKNLRFFFNVQMSRSVLNALKQSINIFSHNKTGQKNDLKNNNIILLCSYLTEIVIMAIARTVI